MPMFEDRTALVTLQDTAWSGWDPDGYSIVTSAQLRVAKGRALSPETLGKKKSDYAEIQCLFYEVVVERIVEDRVLFCLPQPGPHQSGWHRESVRSPVRQIHSPSR